MIVVDGSALITILEEESDAAAYATALQAHRLLVSAVKVHETGIVMRVRHGIAAANCMWRFLQAENDFEIIPFDETQAREALSAFDRYGKGIYSKARLNLADCATYVLAATMNASLLFKGDDFTATDVRA